MSPASTVEKIQRVSDALPKETGWLKRAIHTFSKTKQVLLVTYLQWDKVIEKVSLAARDKTTRKAFKSYSDSKRDPFR